MNENFSQEGYWSEAWQRHIETYLQSPPRTGYWLKSRLAPSETILEIAGGSCRDSRYLATQGYPSLGTDFDQKTIDYLNQRFAGESFRVEREDAFKFSFADKSFDVSFSNGFWVLFEDDAFIYQLIQEQARITRKTLIVLVHNAENTRLVNLFARKAQTDDLYKIRFFRRDELKQIITHSGLRIKSLRFDKFGGVIDRLYARTILKIPNLVRPIAHSFVPQLYPLQPWQQVERIACTIELDA